MANFHDHLILNRWLLSLFNQRDLHAFKERLGDDRFVGIDEETGQKRFFEQLNNSIFHTDALPVHDLRRYDLHIIYLTVLLTAVLLSACATKTQSIDFYSLQNSGLSGSQQLRSTQTQHCVQ